MKIFWTRTLLALAAVMAFNLSAEESFVGTWEGKDEKGKLIELEFKADGSVTMKEDGKALPAEMKISYKTDATKTPKNLDLTISMEVDGKAQSQSGAMIYEFKDEKTLRIGGDKGNDGNKRPANFEEADTTTFTKK